MMKNILLISLAALILTSCYRMPTDDDYNAVPLFNHPDLTREKSDITPQVGY